MDALPPDRRLELLQQQRQSEADERERLRQSRHQWFNSIGILFGVLFTATGVVATALTYQTAQEELRTAREGQITDRYTRAAEQLGSSGREVRTSAVYALERIAKDSSRDMTTITDVLAAFVRERDPAASIADGKLPPEPDTDVQAALTVMGRLDRVRPASFDPHVPYTDLHAVRIPGSRLSFTNLTRMNFQSANLSDAKLRFANLSGADLDGANLTGASLSNTHLNYGSLRSADLTGADLAGADLAGADLTGVRGMTPEEIRKVAKTDAATQF
ncbi:pentapeptide repeat-containing protein [Streptomyces sp. NPDC003011]